MKVAVIGIGGIGYSWATLLASLGYQVVGIDKNSEAIKKPRTDRSVQELFRKNNSKIKKNLKLTTDYQQIKDSEIVFCTVNAWLDEKTQQLDLKPVQSVFESVKKVIPKPTNIVVITTLPYGAWKTLSIICDYCYIPQMVTQGIYIKGYINPPFLIIGTESKRIQKQVESFYKDFFKKLKVKQPLTFFADYKTSEMAKLVANAGPSMKITFANAISAFCEKEGIDGNLILDAVGNDSRVGRGFLRPGYAYGGECLPKDMQALITTLRQIFADEPSKVTEFFETINAINDERILNPIKVLESQNLIGSGKKIAVLGLAYKAGISDARSSPSVILVEELKKLGVTVLTYDPNLSNQNKLNDLLRECNAVVVTTAEPEFRKLNISGKNCKVVLDYANIVDPRYLPEQISFFKVSRGWLSRL